MQVIKRIWVDVQQLKYKNMQLVWRDGTRSRSAPNRWLQRPLRVFESFASRQLGLASQNFDFMEFSLTLCGRFKMQTLNREYRNKDQSTDVLSFPIHPTLRDKKLNEKLPRGALNLGDIFICREIARRQSRRFGIDLEVEYIHLLVHGFLHLCGFDHERSKREEKEMFKWEKTLQIKILKKEEHENG